MLCLFSLQLRPWEGWGELRAEVGGGGHAGDAAEGVPERVDELVVVFDEAPGELGLVFPAAGGVDQQLGVGVVVTCTIVKK